MAGERVTCSKIEVEYFIGTLSLVRRKVHADPATHLPVSGQVLPKCQARSQSRVPIPGLFFPGRRSNSQKGRNRSGFGLVQHDLGRNDQITKTGRRSQHAVALKAVDERHSETKQKEAA